MRRTDLLNGKLTMPRIAKLEEKFGVDTYTKIEAMFTAMWQAYLKSGAVTTASTNGGGRISLPYWAQRINNPKAMNIALKVLSNANWITTIALPSNNWGEAYLLESKLLEYVTKEELDAIRLNTKFDKYRLGYEQPSILDNVTKQGTEYRDSGLTRKGFALEGNVPFEFDVVKLSKYRQVTIQLINKGIEKMAKKYPQIHLDHANYGEAAKVIVDDYINEPQEYTSGPRTNDPRGRNNAGYLDKVGNPVGYKIMRSMLVIPEEFRNVATAKGVKNVFLFIAELHGFKNGTKETKIYSGMLHYLRNNFINIHNIDDTFENVWLERLYEDLDKVVCLKIAAKMVIKRADLDLKELLNKLTSTLKPYKWTVPLEIDMSASVLGYMGILLNHAPFMKRTNMIGEELQDAWYHDIITVREQFKTIMRQCYGSQLAPAEMWREMGIEFTREQELAFTDELHNGELAVANELKNFIIENCNPQENMNLVVWDDKVNVNCNKFNNKGETTNIFDLYDSATGRIRTIRNTETIKVADLKSFRRYFVTGLVHGLDGNVMSKTIELVINKFRWALSIHDAMLLCPEAVDYARECYANFLEDIHTNRNKILTDYFKSIGIKKSAIVDKWKNVTAKVVPFKGTFKCNPMVLK